MELVPTVSDLSLFPLFGGSALSQAGSQSHAYGIQDVPLFLLLEFQAFAYPR